MAKRKVIVECQITYHIKHPMHANIHIGSFHVNERVPVEVDVKIKNKKNLGGELWDWAQSHWDEFLEEQGPPVTIGDDTFESQLQWCCVGGVYNSKGKDLPIEEVKWRNTDRTPKGIKAAKKKPKKQTKKTSRQKNSPVVENSSGIKGGISDSATTAESKGSNQKALTQLSGKVAKMPSETLDTLDVDAIRAEKIKKAMEDDE